MMHAYACTCTRAHTHTHTPRTWRQGWETVSASSWAVDRGVVGGEGRQGEFTLSG